MALKKSNGTGAERSQKPSPAKLAAQSRFYLKALGQPGKKAAAKLAPGPGIKPKQ